MHVNLTFEEKQRKVTTNAAKSHEDHSNKWRDKHKNCHGDEFRSSKHNGGGAASGRSVSCSLRRRLRLQNFDNHLEAPLAVAGDAADEVEQARAIQRENGVAVVGEEHGVGRPAFFVFFFGHHQHWILLVREPYICKLNLDIENSSHQRI